MYYLEALTVCVGPDDAVRDLCAGRSNVRCYSTGLFYEHGAAFNKGAALTAAYAGLTLRGLILHFDSDVEPEPDWRKVAERLYEPGKLYGAHRHDEQGSRIKDHPPYPYGFFQLWHADDPRCRHWPVFEPWHPHAGNYDFEFHDRWPRPLRRQLPVRLTHYGEPRRNWFGAGLEGEAAREAEAAMRHLRRVGLRRVQLRARRGVGRLDVPPFRLKLCLTDPRPEFTAAQLRACMTDDPFLVEAYCGEPRPGYQPAGRRLPAEELRRLVEAEYNFKLRGNKMAGAHEAPAGEEPAGPRAAAAD
jgi:hypothetical protein